MAESYLEFSEVITLLTDEEADWLENQLEIVHLRDGKEVDESVATWTGCRAYLDLSDYDGAFGDVGFEYEFRENDENGRYLWIHSQDHGYVDRVAHIVQKFLQKFRPDKSWSLTYAATCSKPRVGEFGGGAVVVTASDIKWSNSWDFVEETLNNGRN